MKDTMPEDFDTIVAQFIKLRDAMKAKEEKFKEEIAPAKAYKEALENKLLEKLNEIGGDSVKTGHGTVYRTSRKSASISDAGVFRSFVIGEGNYDLVDWRANAAAIADFIANNDTPPPGVNYSVNYTVGVRRA